MIHRIIDFSARNKFLVFLVVEWRGRRVVVASEHTS